MERTYPMDPKESTWKFIIQFNYPKVQSQEIENARNSTSDFRRMVANSGYMEFDDKFVTKLKNHNIIPKSFTKIQADSVLNTSLRAFAMGGDGFEIEKAMHQAEGLTAPQKEYSMAVSDVVMYLQEENNTLAQNLFTGAGFTDADTPVTIEKAFLSQNDPLPNQILIGEVGESMLPIINSVSFLGGKAKDYAVNKIRGLTTTEAKKYVVKSLEKKVIKETAKAGAKTGIKAGLELAAQGANVAPGLGVLIAAGIEVLWRVGEKAISAISKLINDNKEAFAALGLGLLVAGAVTGSVLLTGLGALTLGSLLLFGGLPLLAGGLAGAATVTFFFIIAMAPIAAMAFAVLMGILAFVLLTVITLFIINSGGFIVPGLYETGVGITPPDCLGQPPPLPDPGNVVTSADGRYAYPVAQFQTPGYSCYHWDGEKAVDIFSPIQRPPVVAQEAGTIENVTLNDSLGGKYIILHGSTSNRYYYYAHLCHVYVNTGQSVGVGQVIGIMDETGNGRVQHLHYAINSSDFFLGGHGDTCPQTDFELKFGFGVCPDLSENCATLEDQ